MRYDHLDKISEMDFLSEDCLKISHDSFLVDRTR